MCKQCSICLQPLTWKENVLQRKGKVILPKQSTVDPKQPHMLDCKHKFHTSCITHWLAVCDQNAQSCPLCRTSTTVSTASVSAKGKRSTISGLLKQKASDQKELRQFFKAFTDDPSLAHSLLRKYVKWHRKQERSYNFLEVYSNFNSSTTSEISSSSEWETASKGDSDNEVFLEYAGEYENPTRREREAEDIDTENSEYDTDIEDEGPEDLMDFFQDEFLCGIDIFMDSNEEKTDALLEYSFLMLSRWYTYTTIMQQTRRAELLLRSTHQFFIRNKLAETPTSAQPLACC